MVPCSLIFLCLSSIQFSGHSICFRHLPALPDSTCLFCPQTLWKQSLPPSAGRDLLLTAGSTCLAQAQLVPRSHEGVSGLCLTRKMAIPNRVSFQTAELGSPSLLPEMSSQVTGSNISEQASLLWSLPPCQQVFSSHLCPVSPCWSQQSQQHLSSHCDARRSQVVDWPEVLSPRKPCQPTFPYSRAESPASGSTGNSQGQNFSLGRGEAMWRGRK